MLSPIQNVPVGPSPEHTHISPSTSPIVNTSHSPLGVDEWGPLYGEEEDLERAIQMSMANINQQHPEEEEEEENEGTHMDHPGLTIKGPLFADYVNTSSFIDRNVDRSDSRSVEVPLPPELRHLLENSNRTGAHV